MNLSCFADRSPIVFGIGQWHPHHRLTFADTRRANTMSTQSEQLPIVTITIPTLNEANYIERTLTTIAAQTYPLDKMEIIIADGRSEDGTCDIIQQYIANQKPEKLTIRLIDNPGRIVSTGLNAAILASNGEIIVRVDGHTFIEPDYVQQCVDALCRSKADGVGGPMRAVGVGYVAEAIALATSSPFGIGNSTYRTSQYLRERFVETTHMGAYRKETLLRVGLFNKQFIRHQDYELDYRIRHGGGAIFLSPFICSTYFVRGSLRKLWRQYFQYGFWKGRFLRHNPRSIRWRHTIPPLFVLSLLTMALATLVWFRPGLVMLLAISMLYFFFILVGSIHTCRKDENRKYLPIVFLSFILIHFSWGIAVWLGIITPNVLLPRHWPR